MMVPAFRYFNQFDIVGKGHAESPVFRCPSGYPQRYRNRYQLNQAFRNYPLTLRSFLPTLVGAGEAMIFSKKIVRPSRNLQKKNTGYQAKIKSALTYPIAILVIAFVVTAVIMIWVVLRLKVFTSFGADLPAPTLL